MLLYRAGMIVALVAFVLLAVIWMWLCRGITKTGMRYVVSAVALQISCAALVFGFLTGQGLGAVFGAIAPPSLLVLADYFLQFDTFLKQVLPTAAAAGLVALVGMTAVPQFRLWSLAPSLLVFLATGVCVGERVSQQQMCRSAEAAGISHFRRKSLVWSLQNTPEEFQFDIHAAAEIGMRRLGWSYREMGWYEIPLEAWGEVDAPPFDCSGFTAKRSDA